MTRKLRIAHAAPPMERVPPSGYGGTERVVHDLVVEQVKRGHRVTTFASGDSDVPGELVPIVPEALRPAGFGGDPSSYFLSAVLHVLDRARDFDIIHSHLEWYSTILARVAPVPVVSTFHGRLDHPWAKDLLARVAGNYVAISRAHASTHPQVTWAGIVHNGLDLRDSPFERRAGDALCFVGRIAPEKGIVDAIEIAKRAGRPLRIAAKAGTTPSERDYDANVFQPALKAAGSLVEFHGELPRDERDMLMAGSLATLMPGAWPEPFGLVAIESLACGTPVIARPSGALPEIIRPGEDGFFGSDVAEMAFMVDHVERLDRAAIRESVLERFSAERMASDYEAVYERVLGIGVEAEQPSGVAVGASRGPIRSIAAGPGAADREPGANTAARKS
ncbi:MAG TPA: glycosyltransferase family 4 protein [Candidatus Limnocylindrales bacterium]